MPRKVPKRRGRLGQCGVVCWRQRGSEIEVLLLTSRDTGRWVIPKGWSMQGKSLTEAAALEAWEEAGITGVIRPVPIGSYRYSKRELQAEIDVQVFSLLVTRVAEKFPERRQRKRGWFSTATAAALVAEPELAELIADFPHTVRR